MSDSLEVLSKSIDMNFRIFARDILFNYLLVLNRIPLSETEKSSNYRKETVSEDGDSIEMKVMKDAGTNGHFISFETKCVSGKVLPTASLKCFSDDLIVCDIMGQKFTLKEDARHVIYLVQGVLAEYKALDAPEENKVDSPDYDLCELS